MSSVSNTEFYFDPIDGSFVRINLNDIDVDNSMAECTGSLSEQGRRDTCALLIAMIFMAVFLVSLLYASCHYIRPPINP